MEMSLDLTQMKSLEREARKSEEKYRIIFNTIPNPVFVLNAQNLKVLVGELLCPGPIVGPGVE